MLTIYYMTAFILSAVLTITYAYQWHKTFDVYFTLVFTMIPLVNLGYVLRDAAVSLDSALNAQKIIYIGGCYLIFFIMLSIFNMCRVRVSRLVRTLIFLFISVIFGFVLTIGIYPFFYRDASFEMVDGRGVLTRTYGPVHTIFYIMLGICFAMSFAVIIHAWLRKNQVSRMILIYLFLPEFAALAIFLGGRMFSWDAELIPAAYVFAQVMYLGIAHRICLYDISDTVVESLLEADDTGFVSIDFRLNYLGSSGTAQKIIPELLELTVDRPASENSWIRENLLTKLKDFRRDETRRQFLFRREDGRRIYRVAIQYLYDDRRRRGYQFVIRDETKEQKYIELINHYNADLETEVAKKTENLITMHNKLILGMATMVESRDNSTGGHIRRTSEGVRILVDEMRSSEQTGPGWGDILTDQFCKNLIKAAPMHDLGKIAVDDSVLRKPGRFTPEEFEKMKQHAAEGAHIVHEVLRDTDDDDFRHLAENVAHYHHERWDGSGYPDGLKGAEIPLEARIMAVADVYDALVSKRVYKEAMSFEKADGIIMDGMGKHFDPALEQCYVSARPKLEAYYMQQASEAEAPSQIQSASMN